MSLYIVNKILLQIVFTIWRIDCILNMQNLPMEGTAEVAEAARAVGICPVRFAVEGVGLLLLLAVVAAALLEAIDGTVGFGSVDGEGLSPDEGPKLKL